LAIYFVLNIFRRSTCHCCWFCGRSRFNCCCNYNNSFWCCCFMICTWLLSYLFMFIQLLLTLNKGECPITIWKN